MGRYLVQIQTIKKNFKINNINNNILLQWWCDTTGDTSLVSTW